MITYRNDLSITPVGQTLTINVSQNDKDFVLIFDLYSTLGSFVLQSNSTIKLVGKRKDGSTVELSGSINGSTATFQGNILLTAIPGDMLAEIVIEHSQKRLSTSNFIVSVEPLH